jgi:hypothetical protein
LTPPLQGRILIPQKNKNEGNHSMRKALFTLTLLASALTITAHADTIDDFVLTGNGESVTFSLPATTAGYILHAHFNSFFESAPGTIDGSPVTLGTLFYVSFFSGVFPGTPALGISSTPLTSFPPDLYGFIPYTFTEVPAQFPNPSDEGTVYFTFVPGTYELKDSPFTPGLAYTLTITPEPSTAATPEPSTLLLFATGLAAGMIPLATRHRTRIAQI